MNLPAEEFAVRPDVRVENERESGWSGKRKSVEGKVAERISNQVAFINFHRAHDVRAAADNKTRSGIHDGVCERAQIAARRTKVCFRPVWDVLRYCAFRSAVKDDD